VESDDHSRHICHLPEPDEPDRVWWLGFDCAHSGDIAPAYDRNRYGGIFGDGSYKRLDYVKRQVESLAEQLTRATAEPANAE
jgi:hypothetical protein